MASHPFLLGNGICVSPFLYYEKMYARSYYLGFALSNPKKFGLSKKVASKIVTLKGIVPICSNCKNIRDDKGYWNLLESYIEKHSDASFSHGICPECTEKLYGNEDWYIEIKNDEKNK